MTRGQSGPGVDKPQKISFGGLGISIVRNNMWWFEVVLALNSIHLNDVAFEPALGQGKISSYSVSGKLCPGVASNILSCRP